MRDPWPDAGTCRAGALSRAQVVPGRSVLWRLQVLAGKARAIAAEAFLVPSSQVGQRLALVHLAVARPQRQQQLVLAAREAGDDLRGDARRT